MGIRYLVKVHAPVCGVIGYIVRKNTQKTESLRINAQNQQPFKIAGENVKDEETFTYLGATVTTNGEQKKK